MSNTTKVARKGNKRVSILVTGLMLTVVSASASAEGLGQIFRRLTGLGQDTSDMIQTFGVVAGVVFMIAGLLGFIADAKKDGNGPVTKKVAAIMLGVGCVLTALSSVMTTGADTVWGDGKANRGKITIPQ